MINPSVDMLKNELKSFYDVRRNSHFNDTGTIPEETGEMRRHIHEEMEAFSVACPETHPAIVKAKLHETIASWCRPVIFRHSPFFFEIDSKPSESWGCPGSFRQTPSSWLRERNRGIFKTIPEFKWLSECPVLSGGGFDNDHHSIGYTRLMGKGVNGVLSEIAQRRKRPVDAEQETVLEAMERSCRALLAVAGRFHFAAAEALSGETDPDACRCLRLIAETSARIPAEPPRTFHEGLAFLLFLREVVASLEGIGISVLGHPDRLLIGLYRHDIAEGIITESEARDLIARWMLPFDIKTHVDDNPWPETSSCMTLGGCDEDGVPVWNELTRLFIEVHHEHGLMNPKPNCRISANSPREYLELIALLNLGGHNNFALMNDDILIPALMRAGKTDREARLYVNGGCQEPITENVEHSAGAYYWINLPQLLDLCLRKADGVLPGWAGKALPHPVGKTDGFEEFYSRCRDQIFNSIGTGAEWRTAVGRLQRLVNPCPLFSVSLDGCIDNAADYTAGGARHNPSGICLVGIASLINSLNVIREAVFERKWITLE
ncbi:MAG: pyruvate formate lyase family protein, partial [Victivallales bacterium]